MTTCVLICETCNSRKPFPIDEVELAAVQDGKTLSRHCSTCRTTTHWLFAALDRRAGDRRTGGDRRNPPL